MKVRPLGDKILVKRDEAATKTDSGIYLPESAKDKPQEAQVIAVGAGRRLDNGELRALSVKAGDRILFGKYTGDEVKLDGEEHVVLREEDILAVLE